MNVTSKTIDHQPSWVLRNSQVELAMTQLGGHLAPVRFYRDTSEPVQPYYVNPWHGEKRKIGEPVLIPLRGDFFCLPFGGPGSFQGKSFPCHGETATAKWRLSGAEKAGKVTRMTLTMRTSLAPGKVTQRLALVEGHNVVYWQDVLEGFSGRYPLGHHATLAMPAEQQACQIATSEFLFGMTNPVAAGDPAEGSYYCLGIEKEFHDLKRVPTVWKDDAFADCSAFPTRKGFCDLLAVFHKTGSQPAWTTATFEKQGYLWFSLKDPRMLPTLMMWVENHGRHTPPWNGRNSCLGLEDVCGYFAQGLAASLRPNPVAKAGVPTAVELSPKQPTIVNYIQGVAKIPRGFLKVKNVVFKPGLIKIVSVTGHKIAVPVAHEFLATGDLPR